MHSTVKRDPDVISDIVSNDNTQLDSEWIPPATSQECKPLSLLLFLLVVICILATKTFLLCNSRNGETEFRTTCETPRVLIRRNVITLACVGTLLAKMQ